MGVAVLACVLATVFSGAGVRLSATDKADINSVVAGNNSFAFDLYRQLAKDEGNLFSSPYSVSSALAMTYIVLLSGLLTSEEAAGYMFNIGATELILILVIALIVFGPGKLPDVGQAIGKSIREFKKASREIQDGLEKADPEPDDSKRA